MEVALITGVFMLVAAYAVFEAWQDFERIEAHERIDHIEGWVIRAIVTIFIWGVASFKIGLDAIPCAIGSAFLFSAVFRYSLNRMRGKDWRYVSPSSIYDSWWILCSIMVGQLDITWRDQFTVKEARRIMQDHGVLIKASEVHWIDRTDGPDLNLLPSWYVKQVHRAGPIAYITEFTITAACVLWVVFA
jgi:hypothetical protein